MAINSMMISKAQRRILKNLLKNLDSTKITSLCLCGNPYVLLFNYSVIASQLYKIISDTVIYIGK